MCEVHRLKLSANQLFELAQVAVRLLSGLLGLLGSVFHPLVEPRFAMSMAMALLSFSMLTFSGQKAYRAWQEGGAGPLTLIQEAGEQVERAWAEGVEIYETIRLSLQIESEFGAAQEDREAAGEGSGTSQSGTAPPPGEQP